MRDEERFLVTGASGCVGAWVVAQLVRAGVPVVAFDAASENYRLRLLLEDDRIDEVVQVHGDITDLTAFERVVDEHHVTRVIHLAALQVPFCRENPARGLLVNVVGTAHVFEAVRKRRARIPNVVYASSIGVFGRDDQDLSDAALISERPRPSTIYGVSKLANEGTARVYWDDHQVASMGLRPYVIYGVGRDQGLSSAPSKAMLAATLGRDLHMSFGGEFQVQFAGDVAAAFIAAARTDHEGAAVLNLPGETVSMSEIVSIIEDAIPAARGTITYAEDVGLGLPPHLPSDQAVQLLGDLAETPLRHGVVATIESLRRRPYDSVGLDPATILETA